MRQWIILRRWDCEQVQRTPEIGQEKLEPLLRTYRYMPCGALWRRLFCMSCATNTSFTKDMDHIVRDLLKGNASAVRAYWSGALPKGGRRPAELSGFVKVWAARCGTRTRAGP